LSGKVSLGVRGEKRLNTTGLDHLFLERKSLKNVRNKETKKKMELKFCK
jgi:hypothetical protein